jgi:hypothetical protein
MAILFAPVSLTLVRGTTWLQTIVMTDQETGDPVDLTDCEITLRIREYIDSEDVIMELTTADQLTISDAAGGEVELRVEAPDTLDFPTNNYLKAKYVYDAIIDRAGPPAQREAGISGKVTVLPQVTRLDEA